MELNDLEAALQSCRNYTLQSTCEFFDLRRNGNKQELVDRLIKFVETASSHDRDQLTVLLRQPGLQGASEARLYATASPCKANKVATASTTKRLEDHGSIAQQSNPDIISLFSSIDPFHPVASICSPFLVCCPCRTGSTSLNIELPDLRNWRRQGFSVWLRCTSRIGSKTDRHIWPREMRVFVNLSQVVKVDEPKKLKKRRDEPCDLTAFLQSGRNHVQISVTDSRANDFTIALIVCGSTTDSSLISSICEEPQESCIRRIQRILKVKSDLLVDDNRKLDLRCPISLERLSIPARGSECMHMRCFDLNVFVNVNRHTSNINLRWKCPICYKLILPENIVIDTYVKEILEATSKEDREVFLNEDTAAWAEIGEKATEDDNSSMEEDILYGIEGSGLSKNEVDVVDLDSASDEDVVAPNPRKVQRRLDMTSVSVLLTKPIDIIDLD